MSVNHIGKMNLNTTLQAMYQGPFLRQMDWYLTLGEPDSKVHGANMEFTWDRMDPGGHHVGPMNIAIWERPGKTPPPVSFR